ncbi:UTP--glucose-1-phosphate uridylyltransferase [Gemmatimonadota bacterium]
MDFLRGFPPDTREGKGAIEEHFSRNTDLEDHLRDHGRLDDLEQVSRIADMADIQFVMQREPLGLGDALRYGRDFTGDEPFAVLNGDSILDSMVPVTRQLIEVWEQFRQPVIAVEAVPGEKVDRYGIVSGNRLSDTLLAVESVVEKPSPGDAPSNLAIAGRYVLNPTIYEALETLSPDRGGEIQLTDALTLLIARERVLACSIRGKRYDIGNRLDFLETNIVFGLRRKDLAAPLRTFLAGLDSDAGEDDR